MTHWWRAYYQMSKISLFQKLAGSCCAPLKMAPLFISGRSSARVHYPAPKSSHGRKLLLHNCVVQGVLRRFMKRLSPGCGSFEWRRSRWPAPRSWLDRISAKTEVSLRFPFFVFVCYFAWLFMRIVHLLKVLFLFMNICLYFTSISLSFSSPFPCSILLSALPIFFSSVFLVTHSVAPFVWFFSFVRIRSCVRFNSLSRPKDKTARLYYGYNSNNNNGYNSVSSNQVMQQSASPAPTANSNGYANDYTNYQQQYGYYDGYGSASDYAQDYAWV